jgi:hypothetical protein
MAPRGTILTSAFFLWSSCSDMGFGAGVSTRAIVVSVLLVSMKIFTPLGCQLERGRKRLFNRGIWVGNRGNLLVVTSVTAIRDPPKLSMHPMKRREKAMSMSCTTGQLCTGDNSAAHGRQVHHRFFQSMRTELLVGPIGMEGVVQSQLLIQEE